MIAFHSFQTPGARPTLLRPSHVILPLRYGISKAFLATDDPEAHSILKERLPHMDVVMINSFDRSVLQSGDQVTSRYNQNKPAWFHPREFSPPTQPPRLVKSSFGPVFGGGACIMTRLWNPVVWEPV